MFWVLRGFRLVPLTFAVAGVGCLVAYGLVGLLVDFGGFVYLRCWRLWVVGVWHMDCLCYFGCALL